MQAMTENKHKILIALTLCIAWPSIAFSKCSRNSGTIGYSYCARFSIESIDSASSMFFHELLGREKYKSDRIVTAKILQFSIPNAGLQAKDAASRIKEGDLKRIGIHLSDVREIKEGQIISGLLEIECHDTGDPGYDLSLNPMLSAEAYEASGTVRSSGHKISCEDGTYESLESFEVVDPFEDDERLTCANYSLDEWTVSSESGKVKIKKLDPKRTTNSVLRIHNGILTGTDHGEFGGKLTWKSGSEEIVLHNSNITGIAQDGDYIYAVGGVAHMGIAEGFALKLNWEDGKFKIVKKFSFNSRPAGIVRLAPGNLIVPCNRGLELISNDSLKHLSDAKLSYLYPNSVAVDDIGDIYVGMRFALARFVKRKGYKQEWLTKGNCPSFRERPKDSVAKKKPKMLTR